MAGPISGKKGWGMPNQLGEESLIAGGADLADLPSPQLVHPPPPCCPPLVLKPPTLYLQSSPPVTTMWLIGLQSTWSTTTSVTAMRKGACQSGAAKRDSTER